MIPGWFFMAEEKTSGKRKEGKIRKESQEMPPITRDMTLGELVEKYPQAVEVMLKRGMHCIGCHMAAWETIEQGAAGHGITGKKLEKLLKEMNDAVSGK